MISAFSLGQIQTDVIALRVQMDGRMDTWGIDIGCSDGHTSNRLQYPMSSRF